MCLKNSWNSKKVESGFVDIDKSPMAYVREIISCPALIMLWYMGFPDTAFKFEVVSFANPKIKFTLPK